MVMGSHQSYVDFCRPLEPVQPIHSRNAGEGEAGAPYGNIAITINRIICFRCLPEFTALTAPSFVGLTRTITVIIDFPTSSQFHDFSFSPL